MRKARGVDIAAVMVTSVQACQRDLTACYDLLCEVDEPARAALEAPLFGAYRALALLNVGALRMAADGGEPCRLLTSERRSV
jgi:hypothetical protein